jgi:hypothetical protein
MGAALRDSDDDEYDDRIAQYLWQPGEREEAARKMTACEVQNRRERVAAFVAEFRERQHAEAQSPKAAAGDLAVPNSNDPWATWIDSRIRKAISRHERIMTGAIVDVMAEQIKARGKAVTALTRENETLASQIFDLQQKVGALVERLAQLEARPSGLRAVG